MVQSIWEGARNFGDQLNYWLWPQVFPNIFDDDRSQLFLGIGSILWDDYPETAIKHVFGSGYAYGKPPEIDDSWKFYFVRGPLTAQRFRLSELQTITDPAILIPLYWQGASQKSFPVSFMPHMSHDDPSLAMVCSQLGIKYISPLGEVETVIDEISSSEHIVTEALHGAIVADSFGIPWTPVDFGTVNQLKWHDWCQSIHLEYTPILWLNEPFRTFIRRRIAVHDYQFIKYVLAKAKRNLLEKTKSSEPRFLSDEIVRKRLVERIQEKIDYFNLVNCG